ncbi:MAG TPA: DUF4333 domain-containing protein [Trichocoleus sp.]
MPPLSRVLLLLPAVSLLAACSNRLDVASVETDIKADIERQGRRLALKSVTCPSSIARQLNSTFRCVGELKPEGTFTINVVQTDSQGNVEWDIPNSKVMLNLVKVENQIQTGLAEAVGKQAVIDCGSEAYRVNLSGDRFECQVVGGVTAGSDRIESVLVRVEPDGNLAWQEVRQPMQPLAQAQPGTAVPQPASPASNAAAAAEASTAAQGASQPARTTPTTGPTGRPMQRAYVPGDDD